MPIQVRPGYINPLATMATERGDTRLGTNSAAHKAADLQARQQQLQNTLLIMRSTGTDSGVSTVEQQERLQEELEQVSEELQAAKHDVPQAALSPAEKVRVSSTAPSAPKARVDTYEKSAQEVRSPGIYQLRREKNSGYQISFVPYSE